MLHGVFKISMGSNDHCSVFRITGVLVASAALKSSEKSSFISITVKWYHSLVFRFVDRVPQCELCALCKKPLLNLRIT